MDSSDGGAMVTGTKTINGVQYTFNASGALIGNPPSGVTIPSFTVQD